MKKLGEAVNSGSDQEARFITKQIDSDFQILAPEYNKLDSKPAESANMKFIKECDERSLPHFGTMFYGEKKRCL